MFYSDNLYLKGSSSRKFIYFSRISLYIFFYSIFLFCLHNNYVYVHLKIYLHITFSRHFMYITPLFHLILFNFLKTIYYVPADIFSCSYSIFLISSV